MEFAFYIFSRERGCFIQSLRGGRTGARKEDEQRILEALLIPEPPIKLISNISSNPGFWLAEGGPMREENYLISNPRIKLMHHDSAALEHSLAWHTQRIYNSYFPIFSQFNKISTFFTPSLSKLSMTKKGIKRFKTTISISWLL